MLCLSGFELYSRWVPPEKVFMYYVYNRVIFKKMIYI